MPMRYLISGVLARDQPCSSPGRHQRRARTLQQRIFRLVTAMDAPVAAAGGENSRPVKPREQHRDEPGPGREHYRRMALPMEDDAGTVAD